MAEVEHRCVTDKHSTPSELCYHHGCRCAGCREDHRVMKKQRRGSRSVKPRTVENRPGATSEEVAYMRRLVGLEE